MTPREDQPTHVRVRNLLGLPDAEMPDLGGWSAEQKRDLATYWIAEKLETIETNGCYRIQRLERWYSRILGGVGALVGVAGIVIFTITVVEFIRRLANKGG